MFETSASIYNAEYLTRKPTPLAPLNPNACSHFFLQMAFARERSDTSRYSRKSATYNPLLQRKPNEELDRRRQVFLEKVRRVSDEKKWESRSEQILRKDFLTRQKEWELEQARSAPGETQALNDDDREAESSFVEEARMVDKLLSQEDQEFEALVSSMQDNADQDHHQQSTTSDYGSDEEEYDQLFMEILSRQGSAKRNTDTVGDSSPEQDQDMDISLG